MSSIWLQLLLWRAQMMALNKLAQMVLKIHLAISNLRQILRNSRFSHNLNYQTNRQIFYFKNKYPDVSIWYSVSICWRFVWQIGLREKTTTFDPNQLQKWHGFCESDRIAKRIPLTCSYFLANIFVKKQGPLASANNRSSANATSSLSACLMRLPSSSSCGKPPVNFSSAGRDGTKSPNKPLAYLKKSQVVLNLPHNMWLPRHLPRWIPLAMRYWWSPCS